MVVVLAPLVIAGHSFRSDSVCYVLVQMKIADRLSEFHAFDVGKKFHVGLMDVAINLHPARYFDKDFSARPRRINQHFSLAANPAIKYASAGVENRAALIRREVIMPVLTLHLHLRGRWSAPCAVNDGGTLQHNY